MLVPFAPSNCKILIKREGQRESGAALGAIWDCGYASLVGEGRTPRGDVTGSLDWIRETGLNWTLTNPPSPSLTPPPYTQPWNHPHHKLFRAENRKGSMVETGQSFRAHKGHFCV